MRRDVDVGDAMRRPGSGTLAVMKVSSWRPRRHPDHRDDQSGHNDKAGTLPRLRQLPTGTTSIGLSHERRS